MAMYFVNLRDQPDPVGDMVVIDRHLYLTKDKTQVVEEGDPAGEWLWASPGTPMPRGEARRLGAIPPDPEPEPEVSVVGETGPELLQVGADGAEVAAAESHGEAAAEGAAAADGEPAGDKPKRGKPGANKSRKPTEDK